jgi:hypothetical protein
MYAVSECLQVLPLVLALAEVVVVEGLALPATQLQLHPHQLTQVHSRYLFLDVK